MNRVNALDVAGWSAEEMELLDLLLDEEGLTVAHEPTIIRRTSDDQLPLSFAQERLWFLQELEPESAAYNIPFAIRLVGQLDLLALEQSVNEIVRRHEVLRTTFVAVDGQPQQRIAPTLTLALPLIDLQTVPPQEQPGALQRQLVLTAQHRFTLARGPLLQGAVVRLSRHEHVFALVIHHIIFDGWSMGLFVRELAALYRTYVAGHPSPLAAPTLHYADYALWQRGWLAPDTSSALLETQLQYWRQQLADAPALLNLPTDRPRPPIQSTVGTAIPLVIPQALTAQLTALSREHNATLFMTLLAAFQVLLHRLSGQDTIVVGTPVANRSRVEQEGLIGCFVNMLALRTDLGDAPSFPELLQQVRETTLQAYAHQDLPFEMVVEALLRERSLSYSPLFQVMFVLQNAPLSTERVPNLELTLLPVHNETAKFDLTLELAEYEGRLSGRLEGSSALFDAATIQRLADCFQTLLQSIVASTAGSIARLALLPETDRHLLHAWNRTATAYPDTTLHALIRAQAERTPAAVALAFKSTTLSYGQLMAQAHQLAHTLLAHGARPGDLVGLCLPRTPDLVVALLAILSAGCAYVPLDPSYPPQRLATILADTGVALLVTTRTAQPADLPAGCQVLDLDAETATIARASRDAPEIAVSADAPAYVIATSGSTGRPKGVSVPHRAAVNFLYAMQQTPGLGPTDRVLAVTTLAFDIAVLELLLPLSVGAQVVLAAREVAADGAQLAALLAASGATVLQATPATWRLLLAAGWAGDPQVRALCGGEALSEELAQALRPRCGVLWNMYGPTETTVWSTAQAITEAQRPIAIGRPIANTQVYVLDGAGAVVPIGVTGELYIGGAGVTDGYVRRAALTAERFVPDPWGEVPGARLYRTGDLGRWRADGTLECFGRVDQQVKVRGFRIELGEIEAVLARHAGVRQAVVMLRAEDGAEPQLVAYVVADVEATDDRDSVTAELLAAFVRQALPDYMVPAVFVLLPELPLTPNGKVDRRALPSPRGARGERAAASRYVAPEDVYEDRLAQIFATTLGVNPIGVDDSFFGLGGSSLLAVRAVERIKRQFGWQLALPTFFAQPTVRALARVLRQLEGSLAQQVTTLYTLRERAAAGVGVVEFRAAGSGIPFFCVTFLGGVVPPTVFGLHRLAGLLSEDQPFYGVHPPALDPDLAQQLAGDVVLDEAEAVARFQAYRPDPDLISSVAAECIRAIRAVRPHGPYHIGGVCTGGALAFAVAQQLQAQGEEVARLVLLDTAVPGTSGVAQESPTVDMADLTMIAQFAAWDLGAGRMAPNMLVLQEQLRPLSAAGRWEFILERAKAVNAVPSDTQLSEIIKLYYIYRANLGVVYLALSQYGMQPYSGHVALFQPEDDDPAAQHALVERWREIVRGPLDLYRTPGDHGTMLVEPHVQILAQHLQRCLALEPQALDD